MGNELGIETGIRTGFYTIFFIIFSIVLPMSFLLFFLTIAGVSIILSSILFTPIPLRSFYISSKVSIDTQCEKLS